MKDISSLPTATLYRALVARALSNEPTLPLAESEKVATAALVKLRGELSATDRLEIAKVRVSTHTRDAFVSQAVIGESAELLGITGDHLQHRLFDRLNAALSGAEAGAAVHLSAEIWRTAKQDSVTGVALDWTVEQAKAGILSRNPLKMFGGLGVAFVGSLFLPLSKVAEGTARSALASPFHSPARLEEMRQQFAAVSPLGQALIARQLRASLAAGHDMLRPETKAFVEELIAKTATLPLEVQNKAERVGERLSHWTGDFAVTLKLDGMRTTLARVSSEERDMMLALLSAELRENKDTPLRSGIGLKIDQAMLDALRLNGAPAILAGLTAAHQRAFLVREPLTPSDITSLVEQPLRAIPDDKERAAVKADLRRELLSQDGTLKRGRFFTDSAQQALGQALA